ncbi:MAG TPA: TIGR00645 family protein [Steroidobacteraceae bacterium]|nr:TIGR00645 family protein [Steroidobacteraceae bacterium]
MTSGGRLERGLELVLFVSRWLLAPLYVGMIVALGLILVVFFHELIIELAHIDTLDGEAVIVLALSLIDLSLTANLLLIVMFSGYENFVSKLHIADHEDRPSWMGTVDFSGLKLKLIASIVAISGIALLRAFLPLGDTSTPVEGDRIRWMVVIHLTFVVSGVLLALMDWITSKAEAHGHVE